MDYDFNGETLTTAIRKYEGMDRWHALVGLNMFIKAYEICGPDLQHAVLDTSQHIPIGCIKNGPW